MSVIEGKTYYVPNYPLNLDLRPLEQDEWGKFDGYIWECQLNIDKRPYYKHLKPCGFRWFLTGNPTQASIFCPRCGAKSGSWILNAEYLATAY